jgi:hypothetical protein
MSLKLLQPGCNPLGQFDGLDTEALTLLGGEVVTFTSVLASGTDLGARDAFDGYVNSLKRVVVTRTIGATSRPLMLADEGTTGYGTLFGSVVGGTVGQVSTGGAVLGPHTATGSGKVTCWEKPGLYAVSLDAACDSNATTGLRPTNGSLATGSALYVTTTGLLTPTSGSAAGGGTGTLCGRFVDFDTNGSLVNTPNSLIGAIKTYSFACFYFNPSA